MHCFSAAKIVAYAANQCELVHICATMCSLRRPHRAILRSPHSECALISLRHKVNITWR